MKAIFFSQLRAALAVLLALAFSNMVRAQQTFEFTPLGAGNSFETPTNWNPLGPPGALDEAVFNSSAFAAYEVLFSSSPTTEDVSVEDGAVTFRPLFASQTYSVVDDFVIGGDELTELILRGEGGATFELDVADAFRVGSTAAGRLTILTGATLRSARPTLAGGVGSSGDAVVRGAGAVWTSTFSLSVGLNGRGTLTVEDGGVVSNSNVIIGQEVPSMGEALVTGAGSMWTSSAQLDVGVEGVGELRVENGGQVTSLRGRVGERSGGVGRVFIRDAGSRWEISEDLFLGGNAAGDLGGDGSISVEPGGALTVGGVTRIFSNSRIDLRGGTLTTHALSDGGGFGWEAGTLNLTDPAGFTLGTGVGELANPALALNASQSFGVAGTLTIPNAGALSMLGGNLDAGDAVVADGGLLFLSGGSHDFGAGLLNKSSTVLSGTTLNGPVNSPAGSTITVIGDVTFNELVSGAGGFFGPGTAIFNGGHNPGDSPAVVPVEGNLAYGGSNTLTIELQGLLPGEFDRLEVQGDVFLGGSLAVELLSDFRPNFGDQFAILDVGGALTGEFSGVGEGALFAATGGQQFSITYAGGDGNDVVLTAVPEPSSMVLLLLAWSLIIGVSRQSRVSRLRA